MYLSNDCLLTRQFSVIIFEFLELHNFIVLFYIAAFEIYHISEYFISRILHISKYSIFQNIPYSKIFYVTKYGRKVLWLMTNCFVLLCRFPNISYLRIFHFQEYSMFQIFHIPNHSIFWNFLYSNSWKISFVTYEQFFRYTLQYSKYSLFKNISL